MCFFYSCFLFFLYLFMTYLRNPVVYWRVAFFSHTTSGYQTRELSCVWWSSKDYGFWIISHVSQSKGSKWYSRFYCSRGKQRRILWPKGRCVFFGRSSPSDNYETLSVSRQVKQNSKMEFCLSIDGKVRHLHSLFNLMEIIVFQICRSLKENGEDESNRQTFR